MLEGKIRNFVLDEGVRDHVILSLAFQRFICFLRAFKLLFRGKLPHLLFLGRGVRFFNLRNMKFGKFVQIHEGAYLNALGKEALELGNNVNIGAYSRLVISQTFHDLGAFIRIGDNVGLGDFAHLGGAGGLEIGPDCIIGAYLSCIRRTTNMIFLSYLYDFRESVEKGSRLEETAGSGRKLPSSMA